MNKMMNPLSFFKCFDRNDWLIIIANVLFFIVVQTLFYKYILSQQYEDVLVSKLEMIKLAMQKNPAFKRQILELKKDYQQKYETIAKKQEARREIINRDLTWKYCTSLIVLTALIFASIAIFVKSKRGWENIDTLNMLFVTLAYSTELFFFFFIVRKYEFVGDNYILTNVLQNLTVMN
jgi:hypothetical protein